MIAWRLGRTWMLVVVAALAALVAAGCRGNETASPSSPDGGAMLPMGEAVVKCAGCGKTATITEGATPPS